MPSVVHLKWGERPSGEEVYLLVTRKGRVRGEDYYLGSSRQLQGEKSFASDGPGFPSLASALFQAECVAARNGVATIYVKLQGAAADLRA